MISRHLWNRLKRLEDKIKPRCEPAMTPKELRLIKRLDAARRRMAEEDGVDYDGLDVRIYPPGVNLITVLHAARKRMNEENARLTKGGD